MERSEKSERSAFFYPEGRTYSPLAVGKRWYLLRRTALLQRARQIRCAHLP